MLDSAGRALLIIMDPTRLFFLAMGAMMGLILGILPGIGGLAGTAILLPFTFDMDPYTAFAFLLGLGSTGATGDPIPAVLFGVPGGAGSAATVLDGLPMAKRGEAGRALSACYMSSLLGGLWGAAIMAFTIPLLRPVMLYIGSPELLAFAVLGLSMVAVLSGNTPLRGLAMACFGIMTAMIGSDPQTGTLRWTFGSLYLWDGLPLVPIVLGLFALPELCDLAIARTAITADITKAMNIKEGMWKGAKDCFTHWWLVMRCSGLGAGLGAVPGIGGSVIDWLAYGHAMRTEKGATATFGQGDVRGVIASESSNNAKEGGALVPTVAFGVAGSAGMAILLGAFLIHGLVPGPDMLGKNLDFTYSMVWSVAIANILGAGMCYLFSGQFARLALFRYTLILPCVLGIIYIGAFQGERNWGDLYALLFFGVLGWIMKQAKWPRPPLILGAVLGDIVERYMFISIGRYGIDWLARPVVAAIFLLALFGLMRPFLQDVKAEGGIVKMFTNFRAPVFNVRNLFGIFLLSIVGYLLTQSSGWPFAARVIPRIVGSIGLGVITISLLNDIFRKPVELLSEAQMAERGIEKKVHMDLNSDTAHVPTKLIALRAGIYFGWLVAFMGGMATIGLIPTVPLFVVLYMRLEAAEPWKLVVPQAVGMTVFVYVVFDQLLTIPWPQTYLGMWLPILKGVIPSV